MKIYSLMKILCIMESIFFVIIGSNLIRVLLFYLEELLLLNLLSFKKRIVYIVVCIIFFVFK